MTQEQLNRILNCDALEISVQKGNSSQHSPYYRTVAGATTKVETLLSIVKRPAETSLPWEYLTKSWASGFPYSNAVLFSILVTSTFPVRFLSCIAPSTLFSRLTVLHKESPEPWGTVLAAKMRDPSVCAFLGVINQKKEAARLQKCISVIRWALISFGFKDIPFDGDDFSRVVDAKIIIDPSMAQLDIRGESPLLRLLLGLDGPATSPHRLFYDQVKVREYFLNSLNDQAIADFCDTVKWGSAITGLFAKAQVVPTSLWARRSERICKLCKWRSTPFGEQLWPQFTSDQLTADALTRLTRWSATDEQLQHVLDIAKSEPDGGVAQMMHLLRSAAWDKDDWQPFSIVVRMIESSKIASKDAGDDWSDFAELLQGNGDAAQRVDLLLQSRVKLNIPFFHLKKVLTPLLISSNLRGKFNAAVTFCKTKLSVEIRQRLVTEVRDDELWLLRAAAWITSPLTDFEPPADMSLVQVAHAFVADQTSETSKAFLRIVRERYYSAPAIALALTGQRELLGVAAYNHYQVVLGWPRAVSR